MRILANLDLGEMAPALILNEKTKPGNQVEIPKAPSEIFRAAGGFEKNLSVAYEQGFYELCDLGWFQFSDA